MRTLIIVACLCLASSSARAEKEPWYRGKYGRNRVVHLTITASFGVAFVGTELFKSSLTSASCSWCNPPGFDESVRNNLVWGDRKRAGFLSTMDAYVLAPIVGFGLLIVSEKDADWARFIDDTLPVAETVAISQTLTQIAKLAFRRQRPEAHFGTNRTGTTEDNLSFWSGHSSLGFAITTGAGMICHWRGYWTEPYVWGTGIALSLSTEYLRMAADKHYLSDVLVGGLVGVGSGLLIPRLMRRDIKIVPINNGVAVVGMF